MNPNYCRIFPIINTFSREQFNEEHSSVSQEASKTHRDHFSQYSMAKLNNII